VHLPTQAQRLAWLVAALPRLDGCGIVYTLTVRDAVLVSEWLTDNGIAAAAYFGAEESAAKQAVERRLQRNELKAVVATSALGMGYDKPDLAFVVHFQSPGSAIAYYQQVGRAGRALEHAVGILLAGHEDQQIQDWFINTAFPPRAEAERVIEVLETSDGAASVTALEPQVNLRRTRLTNMLKQLEVEGAVERVGARYRRTSEPWEYPAARVEQVTALRREEQARMRVYLEGDGCLMEHLRRELDDPRAEPCGRCGRCLGHRLLDLEVDPAVARRAVKFLRGHDIDIESRKQWSDGSKIPVELRVEAGKALCQYGDGGWGTDVEEQRKAHHFSDELVGALTRLVRQWRPDPTPTWLTSVPSLRDVGALEAAARRLAVALGLEYRPVVRKVRETEPQSAMENSAQQAGNIAGVFEIAGTVGSGPVLLVDDLVGSRWTLTTIGALLREAGAGPVHPVAFARFSGD
jgi:ATP-dependent DNA helicase RecQ